MRYPANFSYLGAILFVLFIPILGNAAPIGVGSDSTDTPQNPAPSDYIHYVQAQKIKPAQPHVILTKDCQLAADYISSTGSSQNDQYTTCPDGLLPYQMKANGTGHQFYKLYCCKGVISYS
ncbi:MAG: hypothetical protein K0R24_1429 [Gammaproteobacteria bacterium]|jgi:hypothetical protein|nr:hypothetical protein [Gammaproteobacteria bacterium]MCE3238448.1 hypothetical protein [Gammaproteobacteria bacterium]